MWQFLKSRALIASSGLALGVLSALLVSMGNPGNGGIAPSCFIRDTAGALGLHRGEGLQYLRPEIIGILLGSFIAAYAFGKFKVTGGSSPLARFILAIALMIGTLTFLGWPIRATLRLAGGDLNALPGIAGLALGTYIAIPFRRRGFDLGKASPQPTAVGWIAPLGMGVLLVLAFVKPDFIIASDHYWGAEHAALLISLGAGLVVGFLAQKSEMCFVRCWRDIYVNRDTYLITAVIAAFVGALALNLALGQFKLGFEGQVMAHSIWYWNFLGMVLVGLAAAMLHGCPLRQLVRAGQGETDGAITVLGLFAGAAITRNFGLSSCGGEISPLVAAAVLPALAVCVAIAFLIKQK